MYMKMGGLMTMALENIDYTKMSVRGLKDLINQGDRKAEDEYDRRVFAGEIKLKRYKNVDELEKEWHKNIF